MPRINKLYKHTWLTEMYANFGILGVVGGMFIVGLMIAGLERFLCHWTMSPLEQIIGASILFPLFYQDSNFSLMVGSLPLTVVTFWVFLRLSHLNRCFGIDKLSAGCTLLLLPQT